MAFFLNAAYATNKDFAKFTAEEKSNVEYFSALESFRLIHHPSKYNSSGVKKEIKDKDVKICAALSYWIYNPDSFRYPDDTIAEYYYGILPNLTTHRGTTNAKSKCEWNFLTSKNSKHSKDSNRRRAYIVFKGTDIDNATDIIADIGCDVSPMYPTMDMKEDDIEIYGHSGIHNLIRNEYKKIIKMIDKYKNEFNELYITGHSLGGGLSILFCLEAIIQQYFPLKCVKLHIVTFGAPNVVQFNNNELSYKSHIFMCLLNDITHCFVNRFDPVPRVLSCSAMSWMNCLKIHLESSVTMKGLGNMASKLIKDANTFKDPKSSSSVLIGAARTVGGTLSALGRVVVKAIDGGHDAAADAALTVASGENMGTFLRRKLSEFQKDIPPFEQLKKTQTNESSGFILDKLPQAALKKIYNSSMEIMVKYRVIGTFYFYFSQCEERCVANKYDNIENILSFVALKRLTFEQSMNKIFNNHKMSEYLKLFCQYPCTFDDNPHPQYFVQGYLARFYSKLDVSKHSICGNGGAFWIVLQEKKSYFGIFQLQLHIGADSSAIQSIRKNAFWSKHDYKYRIIFSGLNRIGWIEIDKGNNLEQIYKNFFTL